MSDIFTDLFGSRGMSSSFVDTVQHLQIREADQAADHAKSQAGQAMERSLEAEMNVERLRLVTQAMWEFLKERTEISDADLEAKIEEIDLRDGRKDGKMSLSVAICGKCGRKTGVRAHCRCIYCGVKLERRHVVDR